MGPLTGRVFAYARAPMSNPARDRWQQVSSSAWLQVHPRLDDHAYGHAVASVDAIATSTTLDDHVRVRLREAFAALVHNGWEARLGQQIVPWGNADGFNPTDLLSSFDGRFFSADPEVRRVGAPMLWASWTPNGGDSPLQLTAVAVPVFTRSHLLMRPDLIPPGVTDTGVDRPTASPSNSEFAGKAAWHGEGWDISLMAFTGFNHVPHYVLRSFSPTGVVVGRTHQRQHAVGGDASISWRSWVLRAETAWVWNANRGGRNPELQPPRWDSAVGIERPFLTYFRFHTQLVWRYHPGWQGPSSLSLPDPVETWLRREVAATNAVLHNYRFQSWPLATARIAFATRDEVLEIDVFAAVQLTHIERDAIDWALRPMLAWRATDALRVRLGAEWFRGPDRGVFGALNRFSGVFTEAEYGF